MTDNNTPQESNVYNACEYCGALFSPHSCTGRKPEPTKAMTDYSSGCTHCIHVNTTEPTKGGRHNAPTLEPDTAIEKILSNHYVDYHAAKTPKELQAVVDSSISAIREMITEARIEELQRLWDLGVEYGIDNRIEELKGKE